jgi:hypothetical protein
MSLGIVEVNLGAEGGTGHDAVEGDDATTEHVGEKVNVWDRFVATEIRRVSRGRDQLTLAASQLP